MNTFTTPSEFRAAFDLLLAGSPQHLRLYDHDLDLFDIEQPERHACLRQLCVAGGGRSIDVLLDDTRHLVRDCPRLIHMLRDFGHVLHIRLSSPNAPRPDQAFVLADRQSVLIRTDKTALLGVVHPDAPHQALPWLQRFEAMWQQAQTNMSATPLGL